MSKNIVKAAGAILIVNLIVKILGFAREAFIANGFGASWLTDAYQVAYTLPYFLQAILGFALVTMVVPIMTRYFVDGKDDEAWSVANSLVNIIAILLAVVSVLGIIFAPQLVFVTAPNLPEKGTEMAIHLTRIMFPAVFFMGVGMVFTGILNSRYRFVAGAAAPGISNIIIILSVVFFSAAGIFGLAWGTLASFIGLAVIQLPALYRAGFRYRFVCQWRHPAIIGAMKDIGPIVLGVAVNQIYLAVNRIFASGLSEGSISALNYASKLMNLPVGIFVAAIAAAIYPMLSEKAMGKDMEGLANTMSKGLGMVTLVALPAAAGLIVLRVPIVQLLFQRGAFGYNDTLITAYALLFLCVGLVFVAVNMVLTRAYYASGNVYTPVIVGVFSIGVNVLASFLLIKPLGHGGLALSNSLAAAANTVFLYIFFCRKLPAFSQSTFFASIGKMLVATLVMGATAWGVKIFLAPLAARGSLGLLMIVGIAIIAGVIVYFIVAKILRVHEIDQLWAILNKKVLKRLTKQRA